MEKESLEIISIGDVMVDHISDLTGSPDATSISFLDSSANVFEEIEICVGGSAVQFAECCISHELVTASVVGCIGGQLSTEGQVVPDLPGNVALEYLARNGIRPLLALREGCATGRTVIIYLPTGGRLMISDPQANSLLDLDVINDEMKAAIRRSSLVHVSGYSILRKGRRKAILELLSYVSHGATLVALDVVPHDFYRYISFDELQEMGTGLIDWIIIEAPAAHQLLGLGRLGEITQGLADLMLKKITSAFPCAAVFLGPREALISTQGRHWRYSYPAVYEAGSRTRGFSARVQADLLLTYLRERHGR